MLKLRLLTALVICMFVQACASEKPQGEVSLKSPAGADQYSDAKREATKYLAYEHNVDAKVDVGKLLALHRSIVDRCIGDNEFQCVVLESNLQSGTYSSGSIRLRLLPGGVNNYLQLLDQGGEILARNSRADDLTDAVVDTEKRIDMLTKHQVRLEELGARETGNIDALLKIANELATVQSQLEFARGKEQRLAKRVKTDLLTIRLSSNQVSSKWGVVGDSIDSFGDDLAYATANAISFTASVLPWIPIVVLLAWLLRFFWRFFRRKVVVVNK